jgi:hypothetical protein
MSNCSMYSRVQIILVHLESILWITENGSETGYGNVLQFAPLRFLVSVGDNAESLSSEPVTDLSLIHKKMGEDGTKVVPRQVRSRFRL